MSRILNNNQDDVLAGNATLNRFVKAINKTFWMTSGMKRKAIQGLRREATRRYNEEGSHSYWNNSPNKLVNLFVWAATEEGQEFWNSVRTRCKI